MDNNWSRPRTNGDYERERLAVLCKLSAPNPPALLKPVQVKVLKPFSVAGRRVEVGEVMSLEEHDVRSLEFLKKCERCAVDSIT